MVNPSRWQQRYENFKLAKVKFDMANDAVKNDSKNELYCMALIQTFECCYELGWKVLKDFLNFQGEAVQLPRDVIKMAFSMGLLIDGDCWILMLQDRSLTVHTYDQLKTTQIISSIQTRYADAFSSLIVKFDQLLLDND